MELKRRIQNGVRDTLENPLRPTTLRINTFISILIRLPLSGVYQTREATLNKRMLFVNSILMPKRTLLPQPQRHRKNT